MRSLAIGREAILPLAGALCLFMATSGEAQYRSRGSCACSDCTAGVDSAMPPMVPGQVQPLPPGQEQPLPGAQEAPAPSLAEEQFASLGGSTISLAQSNLDSAPNSIGDFFAGGCTDAVLILEQPSTPTNPSLPGIPNVVTTVYDLCIPTPGSSIGRIKLADNNSPLPRDRVFFDYNYFNNTSLNGIDVNRYTPGFEKTFLNGVGSIEMRIPMAGTLESDVIIDAQTGADVTGHNGEFGDLFFALKALLIATDRGAIAAGVGFSVPTASDVTVNLNDGTPVALIENEAVYISPYVGFLVTPTPNTFVQGFVQFNVDANGNPVFANTMGTGLLPAGRFNEQSSLFVDLSVGSWIFRDFSGPPRGLAWMFEVHYSAAVQDADVITADLFRMGNPAFDYDVVNLMLGFHVVVGQSVFTVGYGAPVSNDEAFDGEVRAFVNRYF